MTCVMTDIVVAALYHFATLEDYKDIQEPLFELCRKNGVKGTLLLAQEGINGTIAGSRAGIDQVLAYLRSDTRLSALEHKESSAEKMPFYRMKVRLKKEIVTLGVEGVDPNKVVGEYVDPQDWNALISDPEVIVLDTRNTYELDIGTFKGAINPLTETFREFPAYVRENLDPKKHKKVAMFCTGGIRCEKASSFMLNEGFEHVYHLKGGILKYLEEVPQEKSLWEGECFVFDHRTAIGHGLELSKTATCFGCRHPVTEEDQASPKYKEGVHCPHCFDKLTPKKMAAATHRHEQIKLAEKRGTQHIGLSRHG